jgi:hypothetical protein
MTCNHSGDFSLEFNAYETRSLIVQIFSSHPWKMQLYGRFGHKPEIKEGEKVYKKITIKCKDREQFRLILDKYQGSKVKQSDLIDYLKILTQYKFIADIELVETFTEQSHTVSTRDGPMSSNWTEYSLRYTF